MNSFPFATSRMASEETPTIVQHAIYVNRMKSDLESSILKLEYQKQAADVEVKKHKEKIESIKLKIESSNAEDLRLQSLITERTHRLSILRDTLPMKQKQVQSIHEEVEARLSFLAAENKTYDIEVDNLSKNFQEKLKIFTQTKDILRSLVQSEVDELEVLNTTELQYETEGNIIKLQNQIKEKEKRIEEERKQIKDIELILSQHAKTDNIPPDSEDIGGLSRNIVDTSQTADSANFFESLLFHFSQKLEPTPKSIPIHPLLQSQFLSDEKCLQTVFEAGNSISQRLAEGFTLLRDILHCTTRAYELAELHSRHRYPNMDEDAINPDNISHTPPGMQCLSCLYNDYNSDDQTISQKCTTPIDDSDTGGDIDVGVSDPSKEIGNPHPISVSVSVIATQPPIDTVMDTQDTNQVVTNKVSHTRSSDGFLLPKPLIKNEFTDLKRIHIPSKADQFDSKNQAKKQKITQ